MKENFSNQAELYASLRPRFAVGTVNFPLR